MASGLVASILQRYLGDFLEGLSKENLKIQVLHGLLSQKNVRVRTAALHAMNLPITVKSGVVDLLTVQLPSLSGLSTQATKIVLDRVFVVAGPGRAAQDEKFDQRQQETKKRRLQVAAALRSDGTESEKPGWFGHSKLGKLAESMVQNLTLHINQIHVRYEDVDVHGVPFAAGITLEALHAEAAGPDWKASVGEMIEGAFRKLVSLRDIAVYWDEGSPPLQFADEKEMALKMSALVFNMGMDNPPEHNYILPPVSGSAKFTLDLNYEKTMAPQVDIAFSFEAILVRLQEVQWRQLTHILNGVSGEIRGLRYRKMRPLEPPEKAPGAWWSFAIGAVVSDLRHRAETWTWKWIEEFASDRKQYVHLWYLKLKVGKDGRCWSPAQKALKRAIVLRRTYEQIMSFRTIAELLYVRQRALAKEALAGVSVFKKSKIEHEIMDIDVSAMPNDTWLHLRNELIRAEISQIKSHKPHTNMPSDYVRQAVSFSLSGVSLQLLNNDMPIVSMALDAVTARYRGIEDGTTNLKASLGALEVVDWHSRPQIATVAVQPTASVAGVGTGDPLVELELQLQPSEPRKVDIKARSLDIVFSIPLVMRIGAFFSGEGASEALAHLREDAVSAAARAIKIKASIPTHLRVAVDAPNIVFCDDFAKWPHCTRLIGALGQLTLTSTEEDRFIATISNIRACLGYPSLDVWQRALLPYQAGTGNDAGELWVGILEETSLNVDILVKHGITRHSDTTVCVTGIFVSPPRINVSESMIVDIVKVSVGLALSAMIDELPALRQQLAADSSEVVVKRSSTAVEVILEMPSIEISALSLTENQGLLTKLHLNRTRLSVLRGFDGKVEVQLGIASLVAYDCISGSASEFLRMVWSEASAKGDETRDHILLNVASWPGGGAVDVSLDIFRIQLAMQREAALEVIAFSEALAFDIMSVIPPELKSRKLVLAPLVGKKRHNMSFSLQTGGVTIAFLKGGSPFLLVMVSASSVSLFQFPHNAHLELRLGAVSVDDPLALGPYRCVLATSGDHTAAISVDTHDPEGPDYPGHELAIDARVSSIHFVFLARLSQSASVYFSELDEMKQMIRLKAGQAATNAVRSTVQPLLNLRLDGVLLAVPASALDPRCFVARVDLITLSAQPQGTICASVSGVKVESTQFREGKFADGQQILQEWSTQVSLERSVGEEHWGRVPDLSISCDASSSSDSPPLRVRVHADQIALMLDVMEYNILEPVLANGGDVPSNGNEGSISVEEMSPLDVTVQTMRRRLKMSMGPSNDVSLSSEVDVALPIWIRVQVSFGHLFVDFGASGASWLGSLHCTRLAFNADAFDTVTLSASLAEASLQDARTHARLGSAGEGGGQLLLASACKAGENLLDLEFRQAPGELDDIGICLGPMAAILDPAWLLTLSNVTLPILDRVLSIREKIDFIEPEIGATAEGDLHALIAARERDGKVGLHLSLKIHSPQVSSLEKDAQPMSRAIALSASLITVERTELLDGSWSMDVCLHNVELWKTRYGTDERAVILFPVTVSITIEEVPSELAALTISVGAMTVDFSYQDLILSHALGTKWLDIWSSSSKPLASQKPADVALKRISNRRRMMNSTGGGNHELDSDEEEYFENAANGPLTGTLESSKFRLELASNRAFAANVEDVPPRLSLQKRSDLAVQNVFFRGGRLVFDLSQEAQWCLTVEGPPHEGADVTASQSHPGKTPAQLWDWLPVPDSPWMGRLVLRSHPVWCLAVSVAAGRVEGATFVLSQTSLESANQLWHVPPRVVRLMPAASPSPLVSSDVSNRSRSGSPHLFQQQQRSLLNNQQKLVVPDRWAKKVPPAAQQLSFHLAGGLRLRVVDDLAGNVRPIARLHCLETNLQVSNWDNGGDLHCVFTLTVEADYFNEDSEAWEPLLRGMENISSPDAKEKSLDLQMSLARISDTDAQDSRSHIRATAMTSQAVSVTVSRALVPTAIRLLDAWGEKSVAEDAPIARPSPLPPKLLNETGNIIQWRGVSGLKEGQEGTLEANGSVELFPLQNEKAIVGLRIGVGRWLTCPIDSVNSHVFRLDDGLTAVVDVDKRHNGGREVAVRSNVMLHNMTDHPLVVSIYPEEMIISPGAARAVAFDALHLPLKLCPEPSMYLLSDKNIIAGALLQETPVQEVPGSKRDAPKTLRVSHSMFRCQHTLGGASWTWAVETRGIMSDSSAKAWTWKILCRPPLTLRNLLHGTTLYRISAGAKSGKKGEFDLLFEGELARGEAIQLHRVGLVDTLFLQIKVQGYKWSGMMRLGGSHPDKGTKQGTVLLDHVLEGGARTVSMYAAYWLQNYTGVPCVWYDASTKAPIPGQKLLKPEDAGRSSVSLDAPPLEWFQPDVVELREPVLFWENASLIFRVGTGDLAAQSTVLKLGGKVGAMGGIKVDGPNKSMLEFGVQVSDAPGEFWRTKVLQLSNRFVLVNVSGRPLVYGQVDAAQEFPLPTGSQVPYHWASSKSPKLLRVRFDDGEWGWSGGFSLLDVSLFEVMLRERDSLQSSRLVVQAVSDGPSTAIVFHSAEGRTPMYSIRNDTSVALLVKQVGVYDVGEEIPPRTTVPFAWADPSSSDRAIQVLPIAGSTGTLESLSVPRYSMDEVAEVLPTFKVFKDGWKRPLRFNVSLTLSGVTKVLAIVEDSDQQEGGAETLSEDAFEMVDDTSSIDLALHLSLPGISVSLVSGAPREIFHAWLDSISLEVEAGPVQRTLEFNVACLQVDSQLQNKVYNTVLWGASMRDKPFFHLAVNLSRSNSGPGLRFFNGVEIVMQEINISLDEAFVTHSLQAAYDLLAYLERSKPQDIVRKMPDYTATTLSTNDMVYARMLFFGPLRVVLSYSSCPWGAASLKGDTVERILTFLGPVSSLERAALQLNSLRLENAFASKGNMVTLISQHYKQAMSSKFLLLIGSAHFIGSPITLVESIGTGFFDLWYEPVLGLTHSPKAFAQGVQRGTSSMLSKTTYGLAKTASDLTGSFGNLTAQLSFDPRYIEERERERKQQAQHVGEGLAYGAWDFGKGLFDGVTGLVTRPVVGAQEEGAVGFLKGVGQALSGVVVKPVAGTFSMVSRITEGVKNTANSATRVERVRLPRFIGSDGVIEPYDGRCAEGQEILWRLQEGIYQNEFYVFHYPPLSALTEKKRAPRMTRILASNRHLFCIKGLEYGLMQVAWKCSLLSISSIKRSEKSGLLVEVKGTPPLVLQAPVFYSYELSYVLLFLGKLVRESQGRSQADSGALPVDVSVPELNQLLTAPDNNTATSEGGAEDDFVHI